MRVRDSGMPPLAHWESVVPARRLLEAFDFSGRGTASEFGCGYGTFTQLLAEQFDRVQAMDMDPSMVTATRRRVQPRENVEVHCLDFLAEDFPVQSGTVDVVLLFHILHLKEPLDLLGRAKTLLRPGGLIACLHWHPDRETPRGPKAAWRPTLERYRAWSKELGLGAPREVPLDDCEHHLAVTYQPTAVDAGTR
ncbi:MAG: class I SAM-dependent methyltransferase [Planctomycetota bacterium]